MGTAFGAVFIAVALVGGVVLLVLAILMPVFVYQINKSTRESLAELKTLNTNLTRSLAPIPRPVAVSPVRPAPPPAT